MRDRRSLPFALGALLLTTARTAVAAPPVPSSAYASDAFLVKATDAATLQAAIDLHRVVRLEPARYDVAITLRAGDQLFGLPGTGVTKITVEPGTTGAVVSTISVSELVFPAATAITHDNLFRRISYGNVTVRDGRLEDNLFLDLDYVKLDVDVRGAGWLRNNRFVRLRHQAGDPAVIVQGDAARNTYGNVLLWVNVLTTDDDSIALSDLGDFTIVGMDIEAYATSGTRAVIHTGPMGPLRIFAFEGADFNFPQPILDVAADELHLFHDMFAPTKASAQRVFRPSVARSLLVDVLAGSLDDRAPSAPLRFWGFDGSTTTTPVTVNGAAATGALATAQQDAVRAMVVDPKRKGVPWERPTFAPIPDPTGPDWSKDLASKPDAADELQKRLDTEGIVLLPAGTFYVGKSLHLGRKNGLVGAGMGKTAIVAKSADVDLIVADGKGGPDVGLNLADLTLQGGRNGVHHEPSTTGFRAQFTSLFVSHVVFRDMTRAGISVDKIYGWDNSLLDDVAFVHCESGFQQINDPTYPGGDAPNTAYVDKIVFWHAQFVGNRWGVDLDPKRAGNLNAWLDSSFRDNVDGAARVHRNNNPIFANVDFLDNGGDPSVANEAGNLVFVSCAFRAETRGVTMVDRRASLEGCTFDRSATSTATVLSSRFDAPAPPRHFFTQTIARMPLGPLYDAMLIDSTLGTKETSAPAAWFLAGKGATIVDGTSSPRPQLLVGSDWGPVPDTGGDAGADGAPRDGGGDAAGSGDASTNADALDQDAATGEGGDDSSGACGCRITGSDVQVYRPRGAWMAALVAALAVTRRRRR